MRTSFAPAEDLQKILAYYQKGLCDKLRTLEMISQLRGQLSDSGKSSLREDLLQLFQICDMSSRNEGSYIVNMATLALSSLADCSPFQGLLNLVISRFPVGDPQKIELWANEVVPELRWILSRNPERVDQDALDRIKAQAAVARAGSNIFPPSVASALNELEKAAEYIEFQRFAKKFSGPASARRVEPHSAVDRKQPDSSLSRTVANALEKARQQLQSEGEFDPKIAADLIRSAMDEAHRDFVTQLESITGKRYDGEDKDGTRRLYMRQADFITQPEEVFFSAIYSLISREGSHRLIAPRETVLLLHQTVYSYLLLLTERLHKIAVTNSKRPPDLAVGAH